MNEKTIHEIVMATIERDLPNYCKDDIIHHLYNDGYTDYIVDVIGEDFSEEELPTSEIVAYWEDVRDEVIADCIDKIDWE